MIYASATSLSTSLTPSEVSQGLLYPDLTRIRDVSVTVAMGVIRAAQDAGVDAEPLIKDMEDEELRSWVISRMYDPNSETQRVENEVSKGKENGIIGPHL